MNNRDNEKLKELLRAELSAVETYDHALAHVKNNPVRDVLAELRDNHQRRVGLIRGRLAGLADLPQSSGVWGALAKAIQAGADLLGVRSAVSALEQGEDRLRKLYREDLSALDPAARELVMNELKPEQEKTHATCSSLKHQLKAA